jgi:ribonuclease HI
MSQAYRYITGTLKHTKCYLLRFDGNTKPNPGIATSGLILYSPFYKNQRITLLEAGVYHGERIIDSNESEYIALKSGLAKAIQHGVYNLVVEGDSSSVIKGIVEGNSKTSIDVIEEIEELLPIFDTLAFRFIPRQENKEADRAAREAFDTKETFENNLVDWSVENPYGIKQSSKKRSSKNNQNSGKEEDTPAAKRAKIECNEEK